MMQNLTGTVELIAKAVAERVGKPEDDLAVRTLSGVVIGVGLAMMHTEGEQRIDELIDRMDRGLALVEEGLPL